MAILQILVIVLVKFHIYLFMLNTFSVIINDYDLLLNTLIILLLVVHFPDPSQALELVLIHLECCTDLVLRCIQVGKICFIPEPLPLFDFFFPLWLVVSSQVRVLHQNGFINLFRHLIVGIVTELTGRHVRREIPWWGVGFTPESLFQLAGMEVVQQTLGVIRLEKLDLFSCLGVNEDFKDFEAEMLEGCGVYHPHSG